ncbi:MAG: hypothetical protein WKF99_01010 [Solirubrobacteraceae bacterium]
MPDNLNEVYASIDRVHANESASTRRQLIAGTTMVLGATGMLALAETADAQIDEDTPNTPENILTVAATAEVLATIVNTVGSEAGILDAVTQRNVEAAARHEVIHYDTLVSDALGGRPVTKRIWVPDMVFANQENLLNTLAVGDQIFVNAYLLGTTVFARPTSSQGLNNSRLARIAAEFMGVEMVHRALALQSLGLLGNDRAYAKFNQQEPAPVANQGAFGFRNILTAVEQLQEAGFGFDAEGATPGQFYEYDEVSPRAPNPAEVDIRMPV